jgi:hypothetical protein
MDQLRKWFVVVMLSVVWAVERQLEGNSGVETVVAPLLVCAWQGAVFLPDRRVLRPTVGD